MNWTGGSRNRVRRNKDLQKQREFFQQKKSEQQQQQRKPGLTIFRLACAALNYPVPRSDSSVPKPDLNLTDNALQKHTMGTNWDLTKLQFASYMSKPPSTDSNNSLKATPFDPKRLLNLRDLKPAKKVKSTNMIPVEQNKSTVTAKRDWTQFLQYASKTAVKAGQAEFERTQCDAANHRKEDYREMSASCGTKRVAFSDTLQFRNYTPPRSTQSEESPNATPCDDVNTPILSGNRSISPIREAKIASPALSPIVGDSFRSSSVAVFSSTPTSKFLSASGNTSAEEQGGESTEAFVYETT